MALSGAMAKSNSAGKKPMGSGMQQTTLVARRSVVSPSNGSPKSDQLGLGGKKNGKKKKACGSVDLRASKVDVRRCRGW